MVVVAAVAVALVFASCTPEQAEAFGLVNESRSQAGLPQLAYDEALGQEAQSHAAEMAAQGKIFHTDLPAGSCLAENVGNASSISGVHSLFMQSPTHRGNVLDRDATTIGTGVAVRDGAVYVVLRFVRSSC